MAPRPGVNVARHAPGQIGTVCDGGFQLDVAGADAFEQLHAGLLHQREQRAPASMPPMWHHQATSLFDAEPRLMNCMKMNTPMIQ